MKPRALALFLFSSLGAGAATLPLSRLDLTLVNQVSRPTKPGLSADGKPLAIAGRPFDDGVSTRGSSRLQVALDGRATAFHAWVGVTDDTHDPGPVWFEVVADGKLVLATDPQSKGDAAREITVALAGVKELVLAVQAPDQPRPFTAWAGASIDYDGPRPRRCGPRPRNLMSSLPRPPPPRASWAPQWRECAPAIPSSSPCPSPASAPLRSPPSTCRTAFRSIRPPAGSRARWRSPATTPCSSRRATPGAPPPAPCASWPATAWP